MCTDYFLRLRHCLLLGMLLLADLGPVAPAAGAPAPAATRTMYRVVNLGQSSTDARGINASGQVAFTDLPDPFDPTPVRAHFFDGRTIYTLGTLGGDLSVATGLNDGGVVTGRSYTADGHMHSFVWTRRSGMLDIGVLPGTTDVLDPAINNKGEVVATASGNPLPSPHAVLWSRSGGIQDLGTLTGGPDGNSYARAVNDAEMVVGNSVTAGSDYHAYAWTRTTGMIDIDTLGNHYSDPVGVSKDGLVAGNFLVPPDNFSHIFTWTRAQGMRDLGAAGGAGTWMTAMSPGGRVAGLISAADFSERALTWSQETGLEKLGTLGGTQSDAEAANDRGQVVGGATTAADIFHAFVWTHREGMVDLNTRLLRAPAGLELYRAVAIANNGAIVAHATTGLVLLVPAAGSGWRHVTGPIASADRIPVGTPLAASVGFTTEEATPYRSTWTWGDGSGEQGVGASVKGDPGTATATASHVYTRPGIYTIRATVLDTAGQPATSIRRVIAYDPAGGVVGMGAFSSPAVASGKGVLPGGRASFGFLAPAPAQGQAQGQVVFNLGKLYFRGVSAGPAVLQGAQARLSGSGTINGAGDYRFTATAAPGRFSLRITHADPQTGAEIVDYDGSHALAAGMVTVRQ